MAPKSDRVEPRRGGWVKMTPAEVKAFSPESRQALKEKVDRLVDKYMRPVVIRPKGRSAAFADVYDLYTKWHGNSLVLFAKRRGGRVAGRVAEDFETRSGRITLVGAGLFDVAYFRYTDRWWTLLYDCNLQTALSFFRKPSPVWPW